MRTIIINIKVIVYNNLNVMIFNYGLMNWINDVIHVFLFCHFSFGCGHCFGIHGFCGGWQLFKSLNRRFLCFYQIFSLTA